MKKKVTRRTGKRKSKASGKSKEKHTRIVILTTGYQVDLADKDGLEHLFNAVILETAPRFAEQELPAEESWVLIHEFCIRELHYVAGQLLSSSSQFTCSFLEDEFGVQWDRLKDQFEKAENQDED